MKESRIFIFACLVLIVLFAFTTLGYASSLFDAIEKGDADRVKAFISQGADVNANAGTNSTPLFVALRYNANPEVVRILIESGADANASDKGNLTPLMYAAEREGNPEVIQLLIQAGADLKTKDVHGYTPLMYAAQPKS